MPVKLTPAETEALAAAVWRWTDAAFDSDPLCDAVERIISGRLAARDERIDQAVARAHEGSEDGGNPYDDRPRPVYVQGHMHSEPVCAWPDCATYLTPAQMQARHG